MSKTIEVNTTLELIQSHVKLSSKQRKALKPILNSLYLRSRQDYIMEGLTKKKKQWHKKPVTGECEFCGESDDTHDWNCPR